MRACRHSLRVSLEEPANAPVTIGESPWTIIIKHIVPNTVRPLMILATIGVGTLLASGRNFIESAAGDGGCDSPLRGCPQ